MNITFEQLKETIQHMYFLNEQDKDTIIRIFWHRYFSKENKK